MSSSSSPSFLFKNHKWKSKLFCNQITDDDDDDDGADDDTYEVGSNSCSSGGGDIMRNDMKEKVNDDYEDILNDLLKKYQKVLTKAWYDGLHIYNGLHIWGMQERTSRTFLNMNT